MEQNKSNSWDIIKNSIVVALLILPTVIAVILSLRISALESVALNPNPPQIVCFEVDTCAINVRGKWYHITGIIDMEEIIPEEYKINDQPEPEPKLKLLNRNEE